MLGALDTLITSGARIHQLFRNNLISWTPDFAVWLKASESTVETIFGSASQALLSFKTIYFLPPPGAQFANDLEKKKAELGWFDNGMTYAINTLIGYRYSVEKLASDRDSRTTPNIFISHGGPTTDHVDLVDSLIESLGLLPVVVMKMPNLNMSINEKVLCYMGICSGAIALATVEDETTAAEKRARPNVENEIGMLQAAPNIASRIVYLKEQGVKFASNYQEKVWIQFDKAHVEKSFITIIKELRAFGLLS